MNFILELRDSNVLPGTSDIDKAQQVGEATSPEFTEDELADGFEIVWLKDTDTAIDTLRQDHPEDYTGHFIRARDLAFLNAAKQLES